MIIAIELETAPITDGVPEDGTVVYTRQVAVFFDDYVAEAFAKGRDDIILVDCGNGTILKDANVKIDNYGKDS